MASSRLRNSGLKMRSIADFERPARSSSASLRRLGSRPSRVGESDRGRAQLARAGIRRHDQDHVTEVGLAAGVVRQRGVVHHLQQHVHHVRVRLLDFVEQHHVIGMLPDGVDQQAALLEPDVARRRADEACHGVLLHVLAHVEAGELVAQMDGELPGQLGLAHARRPGEQEAARRPVRRAKAGPRSLDGGTHRARRPPPGRTPRGPATLPASAVVPCQMTTPVVPGCSPCARPPARSRRRPRCSVVLRQAPDARIGWLTGTVFHSARTIG